MENSLVILRLLLVISFNSIRDVKAAPNVVLSNKTGIFLHNLNDADTKTFFGYYASDFVLVPQENTLYFIDMTTSAIKKVDLGTNRVLTLISNPEATNLAYDWISRNVYWTSKKGRYIAVTDHEGRYTKTLYWYRNDKTCVDIAIDPMSGYIFWSEISNNYFVLTRRMNLNGEGFFKLKIVSTSVSFALDVREKRLYYIDKDIDSIFRTTYDGTGRSVILIWKQLSTLSLKLTIMNRKLYLLHMTNSTLYSCYLRSCEDSLQVVKDYGPGETYSFNVIKSTPNKDNTDSKTIVTDTEEECDQFCFKISSQKCNCSCSDFYRVGGNGTCVRESIPRILITTGNGVYPFNKESPLLYPSSHNITCTDFLFEENLVFWIVGGRLMKRKLESSNRNNTTIQIRRSVVAFAVDWFSYNIYYGKDNGYVYVMTINGTFSTRLFYQDGVESIVLNPSDGQMYILADGIVNLYTMNGYQKGIVHFMYYMKLTSLVVDVNDKLLFGVNMRQEIYLKNFNAGSKATHILTHDKTLLGMKIYGDYLFWIDESGALYVCHKMSCLSKVALGKRHLKKPINGITIFDISQQPRASHELHCKRMTSNCSHICVYTKDVPHFECLCGNGFYLAADDRTCKEETPCMTGKAECTQNCTEILEQPFYVCSCYEGFNLLSDNRTCKGYDDEKVVFLTLLDELPVFRLHLDVPNSRLKRVFIDPKNTVYQLLGFDPIHQHVVLFSGNILMKVDINVPSRVVIKQRFVCASPPRRIAVDWLRRVMFLSVDKHIKMLNLDTLMQMREIMIDVIDISIDPLHRSLFIMRKEGKSIERLEYYGDEVKVTSISSIGNNKKILCFNVDWRTGNIYFAVNPSTLYQITANRSHEVIAHGSEGGRILQIMIDGSRLVISEVLKDIKKKNRKSRLFILDTQAAHKLKVVHEPETRISGFAIANIQKPNITETCWNDHANCWGINNGWTCLDRSMVCNGIFDCYGGLDEYYCCYDNPACGLKTIDVNCMSMHIFTKNKYNGSPIFNWGSSPVFKMLDKPPILSSHCKIKGSYIDDNSLERVFELNIMYDRWRYHIYRQLTGPGVFRRVHKTKSLTLSGDTVRIERGSFRAFYSLIKLNISMTKLEYLPDNSFEGLEKLETLVISKNKKLLLIDIGAFSELKSLKKLDLSRNRLKTIAVGLLDPLLALERINIIGNPLRLTGNSFALNNKLIAIYSDKFVFCCIKPPSVDDKNCFAPKDDISGCNNLIEDKTLSVLLWINGVLAFFGNIIVFVYRTTTRNKNVQETFATFVSNLGLADAIMGVYMLIIAFQDLRYDGNYVWKESDWRNSVVCKLSGVMAYVSSEASVMFISLITIDRYLAVKFPLGGKRITMKMAYILATLSWMVSLVIGLAPITVFPDFYSQSGVCIGLPLTDALQQGWLYSVSIVLGFNFLLFTFVVIGQFLIFWELRKSSNRVRKSTSDKEMKVARMLLMVAATDCMCWIPIGTVVAMALIGIKTPSELYAWVVVLLLPVNSAINPFIYTLVPAFGDMRSKRQKKKELHEETIVKMKSLSSKKKDEKKITGLLYDKYSF